MLGFAKSPHAVRQVLCIQSWPSENSQSVPLTLGQWLFLPRMLRMQADAKTPIGLAN